MNRYDSNRLLVITQWYHPELIGTAHYSTDLAEWFTQNGIKLTVLTNRPSYPTNQVYPAYVKGQKDYEQKGNLEIIRLPTFVPPSGSTIGRIIAELSFLFRGLSALVFRRIKRETVVVSFCPSIFSVFLGWLATKPKGRHIAVVHDIQSGLAAGLNMIRLKFIFSLFKAVEKFCLNKADHVIVLSEQMRMKLLETGVKCPISVVPIWVDEKKIYPLVKPDHPVFTLLYSGNLGRKQGLGILLDLAKILNESRQDVRLLIRGNGNQLPILQEQAGRNNLTNIEFEPLLPFEQFNEGLADGDIHLVPQSPSAADFAVPSKIYSIMAAGRPIIATALEGSALWDMQKATDGAIVCVPPDSPKAFSDAISLLLDNKNLCEEMGRKGRHYIETVTSRNIIMKKYASLAGFGDA